jgi:SAM-dependent methyltransferase
VLVAQAWHWVDVERASVEVARVLRPGGYLGLVWNRRAKDVGWVAQLDELTPDHTATEVDVRRPPVGDPFTRFEYFETRWESPLTPQGLVDLIASRSYVIVAPPQEREQILSDVRQLTEEHPDLAGRAEFGMPYVTYCTRAYVQ